MTPEAQRIAIAEACGWKQVQDEDGQWRTLRPNGETDYGDWEKYWPMHRLPNYLSDLNAMHEAEKVLTTYQRSIYISRLADVMIGKEGKQITAFDYSTATAAQRAEAFLRALNLWKE